MPAILESVKKRRQAATERTESPKKVKPEQGKLRTLATSRESSSQRKTRPKPHTRKALCLFLAYEEPTKNNDLIRLQSAEDKYDYEAYTISIYKANAKRSSLRHMYGNITRGFNLCFDIVRNWKDITFDMIAFDWHSMPLDYPEPNKVRNDVFKFLLGAPGFMNSGGIVDIACTPRYFEGHLAVKESLDELFDITYLHEHELAEKCFLSEEVGCETQETIYCKLTRIGLKALESKSCNKDRILEAYDKLIEDHGGDEDICMIRLVVKHNLEVLPPTERLRPSKPHEQIRDERKQCSMNEADKFCRKAPKPAMKEEVYSVLQSVQRLYPRRKPSKLKSIRCKKRTSPAGKAPKPAMKEEVYSLLKSLQRL
jgi:hypothetical protein